MIEEPRVIPECFGDTLVIKKILKKSVNHIKTNGRIAEYLNKQSIENKIIAITDNDKNKPKKFSELGFVQLPEKNNSSLSLHHRPKSKHYIIFLKPALERWLLDCCDEIGFDRNKYPFLENIKTMKKVFKTETVYKNQEVNQFLSELVQQNPPSILLLKKWITDSLNA